MRVIHTGVMSEPAFGVIRQLEAERKSAEHLGISLFSVLYVGKPLHREVTEVSNVDSDNRLGFKLAYYRWLYKRSRDFDVIMLRYSFYDPFQLLFILLCRRPVYTVHHTLEVPELAVEKSFMSRIKTNLERISGAITLSLVDGIIAVLPEILNYEMQRRMVKRSIPGKVYSNGIDYYERAGVIGSPDLQQRRLDSEAPELIFISSVFRPWQGLEELFANASEFKDEFVCHIVGDLTEEQNQMLATDPRFVIHGLREKEYISELISRCDLGLSILAAYKKDMKNIPALKVREYLMEGLAVYAGHGDVLPKSYQYYKNGPINLRDIIGFALENRHNDRKVVSDSARPYIEKEVLLNELYTFFKDNQKNLD